MDKVFITGTNGLLGTNLVLELLQQGFAVKGLVRNPVSYRGIKHQNLELVKGSLFDNLSAMLTDCRFVIHSAAETTPENKSYQPFFRTNVEGTLNLANAAIEAGIERFVFVSSASTMGHADANEPGHEAKPFAFPNSTHWYSQSKLEAEEKLLALTTKMEIVIANPTFMIGAFDTKPSSGKLILFGLHKRVVFHPPGGKNFVYVRDVAKGLIKCLQQAKPGERYLLSGENLKYRDFFKKLNKISGNKAMLVKVPKPFFIAMGYIGNLIRMLGIRTPLSVMNMHILCFDSFYSNEKSKRELNLQYQPIDHAIEEAVEYFLSQKGKY